MTAPLVAAEAIEGAGGGAAAGRVSVSKGGQARKAGRDLATGQAGHSGKPGKSGQSGAGGKAGKSTSDQGRALADLLSSGTKKTGSKALVAEFVICMFILLLSPLTHSGADVTVAKFMKKGSATAGVFIILGFISVGGGSARKVANGLGALVTLTVLLNERSVFGELVKAVNGQGVSTVSSGGDQSQGGDGDIPLTPEGNPESLQDQLELGGGLAADIGTNINHWVRGLFGDPNVAPLPGVPSPQTDPKGYLELFGPGTT
jgi:hypothetical protein